MSTHVLQPAHDLKPVGEPPRILVPDAASVFADRALRFAQLARGHSLSGWLDFLGQLSTAQHHALTRFPEVPLPDVAALDRAATHHMPPLHAQSWPRDGAWRTALAQIAAELQPLAPTATRETLARLTALDTAALEALAERVLRTELYGDDAALLPFVGAALQVYWTAMAARLGLDRIPALDAPGVCPCCGFLPVGSIVRTASNTTHSVANLRYLHCALCNTEVNLVRVKCGVCDANDKIAYQQIEGGSGVVRAETCDSCMSYLKIVHQDKDPLADPVADDLASLALDMLVDDLGYQRGGPNLLFVPGEG